MSTGLYCILGWMLVALVYWLVGPMAAVVACYLLAAGLLASLAWT